jgi:ubiquitin-protein ligase
MQGGEKPKLTYLARIVRDVKELHNPRDGVWAKVLNDDYRMIYVMMRGAMGTPYAGAILFLTIEPEAQYNPDPSGKKFPLAPPRVLFYSYYRGYFHENLYTPTQWGQYGGKVCMSILGTTPGNNSEIWAPTLTLEKIIQCVFGILDLEGGKTFYTGAKCHMTPVQVQTKVLRDVFERIYIPVQAGKPLIIGISYPGSQPISFCEVFKAELAAFYAEHRDTYIGLLKSLGVELGKHPSTKARPDMDGVGEDSDPGVIDIPKILAWIQEHNTL